MEGEPGRRVEAGTAGGEPAARAATGHQASTDARAGTELATSTAGDPAQPAAAIGAAPAAAKRASAAGQPKARQPRTRVPGTRPCGRRTRATRARAGEETT